jgi:hypothetical protein
MKKIIFFLTIGSFIIFPGLVFGFTVSEVTNHQVPETYFYLQEFDKLVSDLTIPSGKVNEADELMAITIQNLGSAIDVREIDKFKLWKDEGKVGFQGMGIDKELGDFIFYSQNNSWYLKDLNQAIPKEGLRIFVSVEIRRGAVDGKTLQMGIPQLSDQNQSDTFDFGDLGIFLESKNNGPTDGVILNSSLQTIKTFLYDFLSPKSVITDPKAGVTITTNNYKILGLARDQGGSTPQWVKIGINNIWYDVTPTGSNFATWEYNWQNIAEGTYTLKTQSADWIGNIETVGEGITITCAFPAPPVEEKIKEEVKEPPKEETAPEKPISEMTIEELKAKIVEIQQSIITLLNQLIQLLQTQIAQYQ